MSGKILNITAYLRCEDARLKVLENVELLKLQRTPMRFWSPYNPLAPVVMTKAPKARNVKAWASGPGACERNYLSSEGAK